MDNNYAGDLRPFNWLASYPKSGNTWLRMLFGAYLTNGNISINALPKAVCNSDLKPFPYQVVSPKPINSLDYDDILWLRPAVLCMMKYGDGRWPILTKTHHARARVKGLDLFPDNSINKVVYIARDPRDVVVSMSHHLKQDIDELITFMERPDAILTRDDQPEASMLYHFLGDWSGHVQSWATVPAEQGILITYEALREDTAKVFTTVLEFLQGPVEPERVKRAVKATAFSKLKMQEQKYGFREGSTKDKGNFFRKGKVGGWKEVLTDSQANRIVDKHGEIMQHLGMLEAKKEAAE